MTLWLFLILLAIGVWRLYHKKGELYFTIIGSLTLLLLVAILIIDWAQSNWATNYLNIGELVTSVWGIYFLQGFIFIGLGIWAFIRKHRRGQNI